MQQARALKLKTLPQIKDIFNEEICKISVEPLVRKFS